MPLRKGWTTGACATAAAVAAAEGWMSGRLPQQVTIVLPRNVEATFPVADGAVGAGDCWAAVVKDAGDDPDVTHGATIRSRLTPGAPGSGLGFAAGPGVGTVTKPGLPLDVGQPAINPAPRSYLAANLLRCRDLGAELARPLPEDLVVEVSVDNGEQIAQSTWNGRLGIVGGLSILGTTGVVIPYSCAAWIDSIRRGIDVARALGLTHVVGSTGDTSERAAQQHLGVGESALLDMGDFVGAVTRYLRKHPVDRLTIAGGFAKLSKLADGHLDLHSRRSQVNCDFLAELALSVSDNTALADAVRRSPTGLAAFRTARDAGVDLAAPVARRALEVVTADLATTAAGGQISVGILVVDREGNVVADVSAH